MPSERACSRRLVYCPPGMPCTYTSDAPARMSLSNAPYGGAPAPSRRTSGAVWPDRCRRRAARNAALRRSSRGSAAMSARSSHRSRRRRHRPRIDRRKHARRRDAAGVVRVEVHRQPISSLSALHQRVGGARTAQSGHLIEAEHVRAGGLQLARELQIVVARTSSRAGRSVCRCSRSPPRTACPPRVPHRSTRACSRPS